ncbi:hypothetical protein [Halobacillus ihumii]|uniref:hypothetical protein n=1 Tax=Halobacillus ihumii TaxID=2686092 RepID=UPI0013D0BCC0|nr:hypothetical protein [Halobacillus ihumii]
MTNVERVKDLIDKLNRSVIDGDLTNASKCCNQIIEIVEELERSNERKGAV